jgi:hypothetical protein
MLARACSVPLPEAGCRVWTALWDSCRGRACRHRIHALWTEQQARACCAGCSGASWCTEPRGSACRAKSGASDTALSPSNSSSAFTAAATPSLEGRGNGSVVAPPARRFAWLCLLRSCTLHTASTTAIAALVKQALSGADTGRGRTVAVLLDALQLWFWLQAHRPACPCAGRPRPLLAHRVAARVVCSRRGRARRAGCLLLDLPPHRACGRAGTLIESLLTWGAKQADCN